MWRNYYCSWKSVFTVEKFNFIVENPIFPVREVSSRAGQKRILMDLSTHMQWKKRKKKLSHWKNRTVTVKILFHSIKILLTVKSYFQLRSPFTQKKKFIAVERPPPFFTLETSILIMGKSSPRRKHCSRSGKTSQWKIFFSQVEKRLCVNVS